MRKVISVALMAAALAVPATAIAAPGNGNGAGQPDKIAAPQPGPGCFGQWRSASMQALKAGDLPGFEQYKNGGALISERAQAGLMPAYQAADHATCDALQ